MSSVSGDLEVALDDVTAWSTGGSPFLLAYGFTFLVTAMLPPFYRFKS